MAADPRWEKIKSLFDEALRRPPDGRRAWLAEACADDELRREVEGMMAAHDRTQGVLEAPDELLADSETDSGKRPVPARHGGKRQRARVGPYRLLRRLGEGGMGVVYQAYDPRLDRHVALKLLPLRLADPAMVARFQTEAKAASALDHPNICTVHDIGKTADGRYYIAMAYYQGGNLAERIARGPIAVDEALELAIQAAAGLARAHQAGIVHRDIKPANLAVNERTGPDRLKILDFGIAKLENSKLTDTGTTPGTLTYMPPEQLDGGGATPRGDLWSLGVVLYEMLTGEPPFRGPHPAAVIRAILKDEPAPLRSSLSDIPRSLELVLGKALAKAPEDRHTSAEELIDELENVRQEQAPAAAMSSMLMTLVAAELTGMAPAVDDYGGREIGDRQWLFERPWNAVSWALACHRIAEESSDGGDSRVSVHLTEVSRRADGEPRTDPAALDLSAHLLALAGNRQTLLTRNAFDLARQTADGDPVWLAHGAYRLEGLEEPVEIFEAGESGLAPLAAPEDGPRGRREAPGDTILGWRPAAGQEVALRRHWRLIRKLGEGGFGEVWLAENEKTGERRAFKFCLEAQRLRALKREITLFRLLKVELGERSDIARILDWNLDTEPYFIESEYSEDGNLMEWAEERGGLDHVPLAVRLKIVSQIAEALAVAHSVGVLHKDVKPSNVLIRSDSRGRPRAQLADFGIGLLTDPGRLEDAGLTMTEASRTSEKDGSIGTPMYRAPELLEGKAATVQADVYALGVMLYQMVAGDLQRALGPGWERDVDDELLREDVAVAVDKSPRRRLGNALRLAERLDALDQRRRERDAERQAREQAERTRAELERSRRRRRAAAVVMIVLTIFVGILGWQVRRADFEAARANREAETAHQVADFLVRVFEVSDPGSGTGGEVTAREILERGSERIGSELGDQPEVRARLLRTLGVVYLSLGLYDEATPLAEEALATRRQIFGEEHAEVAESLDDLAELARRQGDFQRAETLGRQALAMRRRLLGDEHLDLATSLSTLALVHAGQGDYEAAEPLHHQALEIRRHLLGDEHPDVARSLHNLAVMHARNGSYEDAEALYLQALAMRRRLWGNKHPEVAATLGSLAAIHYRKDDFAGAEPFAREAAELYRRLLDDDHPDLARSLNVLGQVLQRLGDLDAAEPVYREALAIRRRSLGDNHPGLANSLNSLGWLLRVKGEHAESELLLREALAMRRQSFGDKNAWVANSLSHLAELERVRGDFVAAERLFEEALAMHRELYGDDHRLVGRTLAQLANLHLDAGRFQTARDLTHRALKILTRSLPKAHWRIAAANSQLGAALAGLGTDSEAEGLLLDSYWRLKTERGEAAPITRTARQRLARFYDSRGATEKAIPFRDPP